MLLKRSKKEFWKMTLRELLALRDMHFKFNDAESQDVDNEWGVAERGYW